MSRYINAEYNLRDLYCYFDFSEEELDAISTVLKLIPTADVVEVVRCKDCKHLKMKIGWGECEIYRWSIPYEDHYCGYGERRR